MRTKKYYAFGDEAAPIHYRPGTSDEAIINAVLIQQREYKFPLMKDAKLIFDFGANIGVVSVILARLYPDAVVVAFEPQKENFEILRLNCEGYKNIVCRNYSVGAIEGKRKLFPSDDPINLGGFSNHIESGEAVEIDQTSITTVTENYGVPDIVKIDVEGAECEILLNFPKIEKVKWITGELHSMDDEYLVLHQLSPHFKLSHARDFDQKVWNFCAVNKSWVEFNNNDAANQLRD